MLPISIELLQPLPATRGSGLFAELVLEPCCKAHPGALVRPARAHHSPRMFLVTEADADAIRAIFYQEGELSAAIELRHRFRGVTDNAQARAHVRTIVGWKVAPPPPCSVTWLRPRAECRNKTQQASTSGVTADGPSPLR
jgi:hypothetical protein